MKVLDENCPGPIVKKDKANDRISKLMDKIRPERETRRKPGLNFVQSNYNDFNTSSFFYNLIQL